MSSANVKVMNMRNITVIPAFVLPIWEFLSVIQGFQQNNHFKVSLFTEGEPVKWHPSDDISGREVANVPADLA